MNPIGGVRGTVTTVFAIGVLGVGCCTSPKPQVPTTFVKSAGDNLTATVGTPVVPAPAVTIKDADAKPIAGITVTFATAPGVGSLTGSTATTDANGVATV